MQQQDPPNHLREAREKKGLSQIDLAGMVGVATSTIKRWESGAIKPYAFNLQRLCQILETSASMLGFEEPIQLESSGYPGETSYVPPKEPPKERANTYFVQDRSSEEELERLHLQDQMITVGMGGPLPEPIDPANFRHVLDVGCGTGGWLIEFAKAYNQASHLVGIDISGKMIDFARERAQEENIGERMEFRVMDALNIIFPERSFDLINLRFATSYLRTWDWPKLFPKFLLALKPEGTLRIVDGMGMESNSETFNGARDLILRAFSKAGHTIAGGEEEGYEKVPIRLSELLAQHGFQEIEVRTYSLQYGGSGQLDKGNLISDMTALFRTSKPFVRKWIQVPDNYDDLLEQALDEMRQPYFIATWPLFTIWCRHGFDV